MSALLFAMVGSFVAALGARDQRLVAQFRDILGPSTGLLPVGIASSILTACIAAWAGSQLSHLMSASAATMFVAFALLAAAFELAWPTRMRRPEEPTRSLGAIFIVLFARQLTDASRFLIAALAVTLASPMLAGLGGAIGGAAAIALGWSMGGALTVKLPLRALRLLLAAIVFGLALIIGLSARGLL